MNDNNTNKNYITLNSLKNGVTVSFCKIHQEYCFCSLKTLFYSF